jgi:LysR family transcriptional regulator, cell division regulator
MDAADLKVFEAVARLGGMNRAAVELNTVQSNITARIQALEADIGSMLLERHSRGVTLTQRDSDCCLMPTRWRDYWTMPGERRATTGLRVAC